MLPQHFYFTGTGWLGYIVYIPIGLAVLVTMYLLLLRKISGTSIRLISLAALSVIVLTWPLWGALALSYEAEKLCNEQGGLHIFKTAKADGYIGGLIQDDSKYGFRYSEGIAGKNKYRWSIVNNQIVKKHITKYKSRYKLMRQEKNIQNNEKITKSSYQIVDYINGEVLGDFVYFRIHPSWFDGFVLSLLPVEYNPWICGKEAPSGQGEYIPWEKKYVYGTSDLIKSTLSPTMAPGGETK